MALIRTTPGPILWVGRRFWPICCRDTTATSGEFCERITLPALPPMSARSCGLITRRSILKQLLWWLVSPRISLAILNHFSDRIPAATIDRDRFALAGLQLGGP